MYCNLGIIGYPLTHTLSPLIHNYFMYHAKINGGYNALEIDDKINITATLARIKKYKFLGINITLPYKEIIIEHADIIDPSVKMIGACNTLKFEDNHTLAFNTDLFGIQELFAINKLNFSYKKVLLLGAGGAARAVIAALNDYHDVEIILVNRSKEKAREIAEISLNKVTILDYIYIHKMKCDYVINSTSIGIVDKKFPNFNLDIKECAIDLQYGKALTPFLKTLQNSKIKLIDGLDMLIYQAHSSFKIWTGITLEFDLVQLRERIKTSI